MYSPKFTNISKTKIIIFFLLFIKQVYMLPVKLLKPLHVTSYHIKPLKRLFDSLYCQSSQLFLFVPSEQYILSQYIGKSKNTQNVFKMFPRLRLSTALSTKEVKNRMYLLFQIQTSVVTNSKERIEEKMIAYMYLITGNCNLLIKLRLNGP